MEEAHWVLKGEQQWISVQEMELQAGPSLCCQWCPGDYRQWYLTNNDRNSALTLDGSYMFFIGAVQLFSNCISNFSQVGTICRRYHYYIDKIT